MSYQKKKSMRDTGSPLSPFMDVLVEKLEKKVEVDVTGTVPSTKIPFRVLIGGIRQVMTTFAVVKLVKATLKSFKDLVPANNNISISTSLASFRRNRQLVSNMLAADIKEEPVLKRCFHYDGKVVEGLQRYKGEQKRQVSIAFTARV